MAKSKPTRLTLPLAVAGSLTGLASAVLYVTGTVVRSESTPLLQGLGVVLAAVAAFVSLKAAWSVKPAVDEVDRGEGRPKAARV